MSWIQWMHWKAYMQLSPFGEERDDLRAALVAWSVWSVEIAKSQGSWDAAATRGEQKGERPVMPSMHAFLLRVGDTPDMSPPKRSLTSEEQFDSVLNVFESMGLRPVNQSQIILTDPA